MNEVSGADRGSNPHAPSDGRIGEERGGVVWLSDIGSRTERAFGPPGQEFAALFAPTHHASPPAQGSTSPPNKPHPGCRMLSAGVR